MDFLINAIASCKSSRFLPVTRTVSPWMLACTLILLSFSNFTIFLDSKLKVQASIQGDTVRVNGKNRDDLQAAIAFIKKSITDFPLQYQNFRD